MNAEDKYEYIAGVEAADADTFAELLLNASDEETAILRTHLGNALHQRLHRLATRQRIARASGNLERGTLIVVPGILGSQLTTTIDGKREHVWMNLSHLVAGHFVHLQLDESGRDEANPRIAVNATGILKRYYGELLLTLAIHWDVHAFWYDWRMDFELIASELHALVARLYGDNEPIYLVAHASGGLVARWWIKQNAKRWRKAGVARNGQKAASKLILLGAPNHGTFAAPLALAGYPALIHWPVDTSLHAIDLVTQQTIASFPSVYQLLPSPASLQATQAALAKALYAAPTYGLEKYAHHFARAEQSHTALAKSKTANEPGQIINIIGYNRPTPVGIHNVEKLHARADSRARGALADTSAYEEVATIGLDGDGVVLLDLAELGTPTLYIDESNGGLTSNPHLLAMLDNLLEVAPARVAAIASPRLQVSTPYLVEYSGSLQRAPLPRENENAVDRFALLDQAARDVLRISNDQAEERRTRTLGRLTTAEARGEITERKREAEETIVLSLFGATEEERVTAPVVPFAPPSIRLQVVVGDFLKLDDLELDKPLYYATTAEVDALAVGHYQGTLPRNVIGYLDRAISEALHLQPADNSGGSVRPGERLLTQYAERGILRGDLAQLFYLEDPRPATSKNGRTIAIAGMGVPGRFNEPELTVLVRELCWALGRLGKRHLATVVIGAGVNNLPVSVAASGWIRGIKLALTGVEDSRNLETITFVARDADKAMILHSALARYARELNREKRMQVTLYPEQWPEPKVSVDGTGAAQAADPSKDDEADRTQEGEAPELERNSPTRLTVTYAGDSLRFGAMTNSASIPERDIQVDRSLLEEVNDQFLEQTSLGQQREHGEFLERLLIPRDLRSSLYTEEPLVVLLDSETARLHWEVLCAPDPINLDAGGDEDDTLMYFWATSRGLTRQLRTGFAPPPEPPPPGKRLLRVLVIADPAADAPLPGALEEGILVAELFERFNTVYATGMNRVEVVRLFGPHEATRANVLRLLLLNTFDVVHFAGHCIYDEQNPQLSGLVFSNGKRITANEISRIDRVPQFVFANACQSGLTRDQAAQRDARLAPTFAEAFFQQGVSNFVCTAWPVGDLAARDFALTLYARLLWMKAADGGGGAIGSGLRSEVGAYVADSSDPDSFYMFRAMQEARRTIAALHRDIKTWGAYQHYGNPYYRFFTPERDAGTELVDDVQRARHAMAPGVPLRTQTANSIIQLPPSQVVKTIIGEPPQILRLTQITKFLRVQEARDDFAVSGTGLAVAVIDTGLNVHHVAFAGNGKIAARHNFVDSPGGAQDVEDTDGHGTHVAGLIAANSALLTGIAPEASVIPLRIAKETQVSLILKNTLNPALQWVLDNHKAHTITAVNLSFGGGNWQTGDEFIAATTMLNQAAAPVLIDLFKQLRGKNIAVVVSAGNDYPGSEGMAFPAIVPYCISVGSVFDADIGSFSIDNGRFIAFSTAAGRITPYSQRLHKPDDAQKPYTTVFAPGSIATSAGIIGNNQSVDKNGTSQAAPVITGLILLMQELYMRNNGGKLPPVDKLVEWLRKGGETIKDGDDEKDNVKHTDKEYVRIDALKALQAVQ